MLWVKEASSIRVAATTGRQGKGESRDLSVISFYKRHQEQHMARDRTLEQKCASEVRFLNTCM